jgi:hypothetical protein
VAVGVTVTPAPLVTVPMPLSIEPLPFANVGVNLAELPEVIVAGTAVKLVMEGAGTAVTVAVAVTDAPAALVTVKM